MARQREREPHRAAPSSLSAGAAAAPTIGPAGLAASHGPRRRQRPAASSDPPEFSPCEQTQESVEYRRASGELGAALRRHRWV